jgi:hypothetical protein
MARIVAGALMLVVSAMAMGQTTQNVKCEANINGFKIHNVYIMGDQYNGVVWAYKHIAEETCLTPVTDLGKADAILELYDRNSGTGTKTVADNVAVSCASHGSSSSCVDSSGNVMTVDCSGGTCSSYYGPDPAVTTLHALNEWISTRWNQAEARIYTTDRKLLWQSVDQKGGWTDLWPDKIRKGTNSPGCGQSHFGSSDLHKYKHYRDWGIQKCGIQFDSLVSIDLKLLNRQAEEKQKQDSKDELLRNAQDAAAKQKQAQP